MGAVEGEADGFELVGLFDGDEVSGDVEGVFVCRGTGDSEGRELIGDSEGRELVGDLDGLELLGAMDGALEGAIEGFSVF